ncbi:ApeA N-terminal domain 1-containing protein [Alkalitalea saponilacus]|uniref:Uncharacterized protein n=1 Tax=Alkalitalea saponilacus TaxID=889453 RepID=A0A1T5HUF1_9BACT|nr:HEPN domain-containing protein [Alkalitalea saponilacus]ASB50426.1 hypothetical protein CDL62_15355 [Alkalitalea saponilacus]ASB50501.1 hypothetical protein CDL62_15760 [Alkalitalea saponilacus]SKC24295.1 hypothetical protein SAMN03080601_03594 [Alkalitalea saponilacus]
MRIEHGYLIRPNIPNNIQASVNLKITDSLIEFEFSEDAIALNEIETNEILLGEFNGFGKVTILGCTQSSLKMGCSANIIKYKVNHLLIGVHIYNWQDLEFSKCIVNIPSLFEWVNIRPIKNNIYSENKIQLDVPNDEKIASLERFDLFFSFGYETKAEKNEIHLKQHTYLKIVSKEKKLLIEEYMEIITHFKKFLLFIINKSPISESISFYDSKHNIENTNTLIPIELITPSKKNESPKSISLIRIDYTEIATCFEDIIKNWFENNNLKPSVDLIIEKFLNPKLSRENDFLNACFAIETFHRRFKTINTYSKAVFKKIRKDIIENIEDDDIKNFIYEKLSYANEPTFRTRLFDLKEYFESILASNINIDEYIIKIVKTRNFLVHRGDNKKTFNELDMFFAARYLENIVRICILIELKVPENIVLNIQNCNKNYLQSLYEINKKTNKTVPNGVYNQWLWFS